MNIECITCHNCLSVDNFHKDISKIRGYRSECKSCTKIKSANYYKKNRLNILHKNRVSREIDTEFKRAKGRDYAKNNPEKFKEYRLKYRKENILKERARKMTDKAIRRYGLPKQPCRMCKNKIAEAHHCDYTKPLDILWLCVKHHSAWHRIFLTEQE